MNEVQALLLTGLLSVIAIITAPITALWVQRKGDDARALRKRREDIFKALWLNRTRPMYIARVDALNMIAVEFYGQKKVADAWADLLAHYNTDYQAAGVAFPEQQRLHVEKYTALLYEMGQVLGYEFGKTEIRDNAYRPVLHNDVEQMDLETRRVTLELLKSVNALDALPVRWQNTAPEEPPKEE
jgi:hypothetical protein